MKKLLIIDDEESVRRSLNFFMKEYFEVRTAGSYKEAINICESDRFDCVVSDYYMNKETGENVLEFMKSKFNYPVIVMTGAANKDNILRLTNKKVDFVLEKPFNNHDLKNKIEELILNHEKHVETENLGHRNRILGNLFPNMNVPK